MFFKVRIIQAGIWLFDYVHLQFLILKEHNLAGREMLVYQKTFSKNQPRKDQQLILRGPRQSQISVN